MRPDALPRPTPIFKTDRPKRRPAAPSSPPAEIPEGYALCPACRNDPTRVPLCQVCDGAGLVRSEPTA